MVSDYIQMYKNVQRENVTAEYSPLKVNFTKYDLALISLKESDSWNVGLSSSKVLGEKLFLQKITFTSKLDGFKKVPLATVSPSHPKNTIIIYILEYVDLV